MDNLCCCEYWDLEGNRNHLLGCCCNCQHLDDGFEGLISGSGVSPYTKKRIALTFFDRIRIPWLGGAKKISQDAALPILVLPSLILFATINLACTVIAGIIMITLLVVIYLYYLDTLPKFFIMWTITSIIMLYAVFQSIVVSFLMICLEENLTVSACMFIFIFLVSYIKFETHKQKGSILTPDKSMNKREFCNVCQNYITEDFKHRYWIDTCITPSNIKLYIPSLFFALIALLYSSNLTLTTVCHPFSIYLTILLPDDCSDVYNLIELGLSFVSAVYSLLLSLFILWEIFSTLNMCFVGCRRPTSRLEESHFF